MPRHTDGRPEEGFLERARQRREALDEHEPVDDEDIATMDAVVDADDLDDQDQTLPEQDARVPPWWRIRRHPIGPARGLILAVILVFGLSILTIGLWTLTTGDLPDASGPPSSPQALPGEEDRGEPVRPHPF